jgi:hypothetical protein
MVFHCARLVLGTWRGALWCVHAGIFASSRYARQIRLAVVVQSALLLVHGTGQLAIFVHHEAEFANAHGFVVAHDALLELVTFGVSSGAGIFAHSISRAGKALVAVVMGLAWYDSVGNPRSGRSHLFALRIGFALLVGTTSVAIGA